MTAFSHHGPHPRYALHVTGHEAAVNDFMGTWSTGRLHHAWLITGPRGIGKATLAYALAKWVMATDRTKTGLELPLAHKMVKQVAAGSCPTLLSIEPEEDEKSGVLKEIGVDEARRVQPFLRLTAADDAWRVVLIDNADMLSTEGQNAILKFVEEPPLRCLILLTASQPGRLLPTIKSRVRTLKLDPLSDSELGQIAKRLNVQVQHNKSWVMRHAGGSAGALLHLAALDAGALGDMVEKLVAGLPAVNWAAVHELAGQVARKEQDSQFRLVLELLNDAITERLKTLRTASPLWDDVQMKFRLAPERHLDRTATIIDIMASASKMMQSAGNMAA